MGGPGGSCSRTQGGGRERTTCAHPLPRPPLPPPSSAALGAACVLVWCGPGTSFVKRQLRRLRRSPWPTKSPRARRWLPAPSRAPHRAGRSSGPGAPRHFPPSLSSSLPRRRRPRRSLPPPAASECARGASWAGRSRTPAGPPAPNGDSWPSRPARVRRGVRARGVSTLRRPRVGCCSLRGGGESPGLGLHLSGEGVKTENNDHINLKVAGQDGSVVQFKIKRHTPLSKLMKAYCERQGLSMRQIRFRFDGQPINETDTPAQDQLDCLLWQKLFVSFYPLKVPLKISSFGLARWLMRAIVKITKCL
uniref:Small ubiquitin-related modifier 2 n=1 Tax=Papio anubis TaxID=9555 RepID=A0A8I5R1I7_PAPAN